MILKYKIENIQNESKTYSKKKTTGNVEFNNKKQLAV